MPKTRLFIVDDHSMIIDGISAMFESDKEIEIAGSANTVDSALESVENTSFDVLILDIRMGNEERRNEPDGFDILRAVKQSKPDVKTLMLTMHEEPTYIRTAMDEGANGYLLKNTGKTDFKKAIETIMAGDFYLSGKVAQNLIGFRGEGQAPTQVIEISNRELEVIQLICEEKTTEEIANSLDVQVSTIKSHRKNILTKLGVRNVAGLVRYAMEHDLID
ncbi:MAG: response regulator transcription factor [Flavobacteriales bacterium]|uniref:response regulator n=1 Tax=Sanyastnella coralliicola TaxID=3069118 RepID=UPI0027B8AA91|nr:response regulator transcription factor [Longitalea sp. SCSIO 12813]MCH2197189.1 response regulator transcription factor [Flavobacteriales bacterium]